MVFNAIRNLNILPIRQPKVRSLSKTDVIVRVPQKAIRNQKHLTNTLAKFGKVGARFIDKQDRLCFVVRVRPADVANRTKLADSIRFVHRAKLADMAITVAYV